MVFVAKLIVLARPILLVVLTAVAGAAYAQILFLSLPIPKALGLFTVVLPLITGVSTHGTSVLVQRASKKERAQLSLPLLAVIGFQLVYETIIATLAITHIIPPSALKCGLDVKWAGLYGNKDERAIRAIQEGLQCCGFNSPKDRAWPFPTADKDGHTVPSKCADYTGRKNSCFGDWRKAEQVNAGLLLLVAVVVFIVKILAVISLLTNVTGSRPSWVRYVGQITNGNNEDPEQDNRATVRRLIEEGNPVEQYHDEPEEESSEAIHAVGSNQHPRVQPSQLVDHNNEWRD